MAALQASAPLSSSSTVISCSSNKRVINAAIHVPKLPQVRFTAPKQQITRPFLEELKTGLIERKTVPTTRTRTDESRCDSSASTQQLYAILEAVSDRIEMHKNIGEQRDNWNALLLNSINMITFTATTMAGVAATGAGGGVLALKLSSAFLFSAAAGMLVLMNKLQPSQLAEEQRNASRLFAQLKTQIESTLSLRTPTQVDVNEAIKRVLALDEAYPLPLLGKMIEKFPSTFKPAKWWPSNDQIQKERKQSKKTKMEKNGWSEDLESEMREIVTVLKMKDTEDYMKLGSTVLKINKILAISGPVLTGVAATGAALMGSSPNGSLAGIVAVLAGAMAGVVNTLEHGAQVGTVVDMYRNSAGFFRLMEETIESTLGEEDWEKRENGELFETKVALKLGRSLSQLRELARKSSARRLEEIPIDEFASKLF